MRSIVFDDDDDDDDDVDCEDGEDGKDGLYSFADGLNQSTLNPISSPAV